VIEYPQKTIKFKNQSRQDHLPPDAVDELVAFVNGFKDRAPDIFVYGTSIFRDLTAENKTDFLRDFKNRTGAAFNIVTPEQEGEYTVKGVCLGNDFRGRLAVMIGGGGSTEVCIVENKNVIERHCNNFGAITVTREFEQIVDFKPKMSMEEVDAFCLAKTEDITNRADILVIAGGDHKFHYECAAKDFLEPNEHFSDDLAPYSVAVENVFKIDRRFIFEEDLGEYIKKYNEMSEIWWRGTRSMRFCVRAVAKKCGARFVIPTKINMCLGIINELKLARG
jgi:hypothetical protein